MVAAEIVPHFFLVVGRWLPLHSLSGCVEDLIAKGLAGGDVQFLVMGGIVCVIEVGVAVIF